MRVDVEAKVGELEAIQFSTHQPSSAAKHFIVGGKSYGGLQPGCIAESVTFPAARYFLGQRFSSDAWRLPAGSYSMSTTTCGLTSTQLHAVRIAPAPPFAPATSLQPWVLDTSA